MRSYSGFFSLSKVSSKLDGVPVSDPLFPLGKIVATPGAIQELEKAGKQPETYLRRHQAGDWRDCCAEDKRVNEQSLHTGMRIISVYFISADQKIWIITEADRSSTCILLPDEY
tara:strand:- start:125246 stop:125587 length:342 start_codon:yes stop_codon:yes gene_type:complete